ncbi:Mitochondrial distribution and morphology protein [Rhizoctonia solani]|uniref:Mitochondrial distribution and morphology protein n=1 Tax=Rhizoctonia solani TaxID=456999 RepID=A0A8H7IJJ3_9AGAM|nr:Mitochondrial distribution and morphology protein [Rhizoctonia solani]
MIRYTSIRNFFHRIAQDTDNIATGCRPHIRQYQRHSWQRTTLLGITPLSTHNTCGFRYFAPRYTSSSTHGNRSDPGPSSKSSTTPTSHDPHSGQDSQPNSQESKEAPKELPAPTNPHIQNYSSLFRQLALSLPHVKQPTKQDFLQAATSMWQRMRIRFKWFAIKSFRKFNADDISAFLSWFLVGQTLWILVGTTTFFSVVFAVLNSLRLQVEYVARSISDYLTSETGVRIVFESAVVPKWKDSRISFRNVYISRRQDSQTEEALPRDAGQRAAARLDAWSCNWGMNVSDVGDPVDTGDDGWTTFDLEIDSVDVTLSFARWLEGRGLIKNAAVKGVRGVVDRRSVSWDPEVHADPTEFRHPPQLGDFELDSLEVEDLLVTLYQPGAFRPFTASIFRANFGKQFENMTISFAHPLVCKVVGQYDNCLFSLHTPQSIGRTMEQEVKDSRWTRMSRFRIDGVNIDHLQAATGNEGLVSWIVSGKVDAIIEGIAAAAAEQIEEARRAGLELGIPLISDRIPGQRELAKPALSAPEDENELKEEYEKPVVLIDIDLRFRDLKAAMPLFTNELSYVNHALVRPIVSFINANHTLVPIRCRIVKDLDDFHGSWTMWETGLTDIISQKASADMSRTGKN